MKNKLFLSVSVVALLSGCHPPSPSINIVGAYFPDWLFCIVGGTLSTVVIYIFLSSKKRENWLSPYILTYPLLIALFSIGYWTFFFN
ncbi:TPA: hypothetical protein PFA69_003709 [Serratia marcescens]|nr:hypothetical protein [Serratia marcescens]